MSQRRGQEAVLEWLHRLSQRAREYYRSHAASENRPLYSPEGPRRAFVSTRTSGGDVYILMITTRDVRRRPYDEAPRRSKPGVAMELRSTSLERKGHRWDAGRISREVGGGTHMVVASDRYTVEYWAPPSPDSAAATLTARGPTSGRRGRRDRNHIDESETWVVRPNAKIPSYEVVTTGGAKSAFQVWGGSVLFLMTDRSGAGSRGVTNTQLATVDCALR